MGTYNTKGVLLETPAVSAGKAGDANAQVKAADTQIETLDALQMLLDVVGLVPGLGSPADLLNGIISAARGDFIGAGLSLLGVVPIAGEAATVGKIAKNSEKYLQALDVVATKVVPHLPPAVGRKIEDAIGAARGKIDEIAEGKAKPTPTPKVEDAPKAKSEGNDGGKIKPREHHVPCFHPFDKQKFGRMSASEQKEYLKEMAEQLQRQQHAINGMTAVEYRAARDAFASVGRNPLADGAQAAYRAKAEAQIQRSIRSSMLDSGMPASAAQSASATKTKDIMSRLAGLHEPDMVAGGWSRPGPAALGRTDVNASIGASWNQEGRLSAMDKAAEDAIRSGDGNQKMNVRLEPCRGKGMK